MKIIVVDDEQHARNRLNKHLSEVTTAEVVLFDRSASALDYAKESKIDVAFLDIAMPEMNGIALAKELKKTNPLINVIFCTGYSNFMQEAIKLHASGYLLKPASVGDVKQALDDLLHPVEPKKPHFYAKTFGEFDFFVDGAPLHFKRSKAKEMLAYLISIRGASASRKDVAARLFGDKYDIQTQDYLTKIYKDLSETLAAFGAEKLLQKGYNTYSVDTALFSCDLYDYDKGLPEAINAYKGEFMAQYEWAEF